MVYIDEKRLQAAFLEEVTELLESLNEKLLELEDKPKDQEIINEIFRLTHSIKSESSLVGFMNISAIAHKMEDIFEKVRKNTLVVDRQITDVLFIAYDKIMELIAAVQNNKDESAFDVSKVVNKLIDILKVDGTYVETSTVKENTKISGAETKEGTGLLSITEIKVDKIGFDFSDFEKGQIEDGLEKGLKFYKIFYHLSKDCDMRYPRAYLVYNNLTGIGTVVKTIPDILLEASDEKFSTVELYILTSQTFDDIKKCAEVDQVDKIEVGKIGLDLLKGKGLDLSNVAGYTDMMISQEMLDEAEKAEKDWIKEMQSSIGKEVKSPDKTGTKKDDGTIESSGEPEKEEETPAVRSAEEKTIKKQTIRVETDRLDSLMNLVGELIINHSRFMQIKNSVTEQASIPDLKSEIEDATNDLERISDQMQTGMVQVRMVPIGNVFSRFPRMVRDLANSLKKNVDLMIIGEETEIDRAVIELITEPLTHLIRNSIDHGIENPDERIKRGKPSDGVITLNAYQQGSSIYIEVTDDGKGINIEKVKEKGIEKGLITSQMVSAMTQEELLNLIFEPGFSTKDEITGISGRGVGMDVVKNQIEKLRGSIKIETKQGLGTTITIILPLTLTIVEALLVNVGKSIFAIPINVVVETLFIRKEEIADFDDYKIYNLRKIETLAILELAELVQLPRTGSKDEVFVVVVSFEGKKVGLIVDELMGDQDIFIKALDSSLKSIEGIAGATVLGDGRIALILDVGSLVKSRIKEINRIMSETYNFFTKEEGSGFNKVFDELNKAKDSISKHITESAEPLQDEIELKPVAEHEDEEEIEELQITEADLLDEPSELESIESNLVDESSFMTKEEADKTEKAKPKTDEKDNDEIDEIETSLKELEETLKNIRKID